MPRRPTLLSETRGTAVNLSHAPSGAFGDFSGQAAVGQAIGNVATGLERLNATLERREALKQGAALENAKRELKMLNLDFEVALDRSPYDPAEPDDYANKVSERLDSIQASFDKAKIPTGTLDELVKEFRVDPTTQRIQLKFNDRLQRHVVNGVASEAAGILTGINDVAADGAPDRIIGMGERVNLMLQAFNSLPPELTATPRQENASSLVAMAAADHYQFAKGEREQLFEMARSLSKDPAIEKQIIAARKMLEGKPPMTMTEALRETSPLVDIAARNGNLTHLSNFWTGFLDEAEKNGVPIKDRQRFQEVANIQLHTASLTNQIVHAPHVAGKPLLITKEEMDLAISDPESNPKLWDKYFSSLPSFLTPAAKLEIAKSVRDKVGEESLKHPTSRALESPEIKAVSFQANNDAINPTALMDPKTWVKFDQFGEGVKNFVSDNYGLFAHAEAKYPKEFAARLWDTIANTPLATQAQIYDAALSVDGGTALLQAMEDLGEGKSNPLYGLLTIARDLPSHRKSNIMTLAMAMSPQGKVDEIYSRGEKITKEQVEGLIGHRLADYHAAKFYGRPGGVESAEINVYARAAMMSLRQDPGMSLDLAIANVVNTFVDSSHIYPIGDQSGEEIQFGSFRLLPGENFHGGIFNASLGSYRDPQNMLEHFRGYAKEWLDIGAPLEIPLWAAPNITGGFVTNLLDIRWRNPLMAGYDLLPGFIESDEPSLDDLDWFVPGLPSEFLDDIHSPLSRFFTPEGKETPAIEIYKKIAGADSVKGLTLKEQEYLQNLRFGNMISGDLMKEIKNQMKRRITFLETENGDLAPYVRMNPYEDDNTGLTKHSGLVALKHWVNGEEKQVVLSRKKIHEAAGRHRRWLYGGINNLIEGNKWEKKQ